MSDNLKLQISSQKSQNRFCGNLFLTKLPVVAFSLAITISCQSGRAIMPFKNSPETKIYNAFSIPGTTKLTLYSEKSDRQMKNLDKITTYEGYEQNWNGNDANPFSKELLGKTRSMIMQLYIQPEIFPTANDSIQFEYENEKGDYLEFQLFENNDLKIFKLFSNGTAEEGLIDFNIKEINRVVQKFYEI